MMAKMVYLFCVIASITCAGMLIRSYKQNGTRLLLLSSLCFVGLAANNTFLFVDLVMMPEINLWGALWRNFIGAASGSLLLCGLIWELT